MKQGPFNNFKQNESKKSSSDCRGMIDLHTHSTASDGSYSPSGLIELANEIKLSAIALTDHDTVSGIDQFMATAEKYPDIIPIPGVEVSVNYGHKELHIVGLFIDYKSESLNEMLSEIRKNRNARNELIIEKLQGMGYDITIDEVLEIAGGDSIGRPLFAKILIQKGYFKEPQDVFDHCLKRGKPGYCNRVLPSPKDAIEAIHNAGGVAIWAHPLYRAQTDRTFLRTALKNIMQYNLDGIEALYTTFTPSQVRAVKEIAYEFSIEISGGTDFHGTNQIGIELGRGNGDLEVPFSIYEALSKKAKMYANK